MARLGRRDPRRQCERKDKRRVDFDLKEAVKDILDLRCEEARKQAEDDFEEVPLVI